MKRFAAVLALLLSIATTPALASTYEEADKAYDAGDYEKAKSILLPLAEAGNADAMNLIGLMHDHGNGFKKNEKAACDWYERAAVIGEAIAQSNYATCYYSGEGRELNPDKAVHWESKAAMQGDVTAQINLMIHFHETDKAEARKWGQMAVDAGNRAVRAGMWAYEIDYVGPPPSPIDKFCALVMVGLLDKPFSYCDDWP